MKQPALNDPFIRIEAAFHIVLKRLSLGDSQIVYELIKKSQSHFQHFDAFISEVHTKEQTDAILLKADRLFEQGTGLVLGLWVESDLAGTFSIKNIDWNKKTAEVGYWMGEGFTGRGLASMGLNAVVHYSFETLGLNRLEAFTAASNTKSIQLLERVGFLFEKKITSACEIRGRKVDDVLYVIKF